MSERTRRLDHIFGGPKRGAWILTGVIIALGVAVFVWAFAPSERRRIRLVNSVEIGEPAGRVANVTGASIIPCPVAPLDHLSESFPDGWPPAAVDVALERLEVETAERWVLELDEEDNGGCGPVTDRTEIGVAADGTLLWTFALLGTTPVRLPPWITPSGVAEELRTDSASGS